MFDQFSRVANGNRWINTKEPGSVYVCVCLCGFSLILYSFPLLTNALFLTTDHPFSLFLIPSIGLYKCAAEQYIVYRWNAGLAVESGSWQIITEPLLGIRRRRIEYYNALSNHLAEIPPLSRFCTHPDTLGIIGSGADKANNPAYATQAGQLVLFGSILDPLLLLLLLFSTR